MKSLKTWKNPQLNPTNFHIKKLSKLPDPTRNPQNLSTIFNFNSNSRKKIHFPEFPDIKNPFKLSSSRKLFSFYFFIKERARKEKKNRISRCFNFLEIQFSFQKKKKKNFSQAHCFSFEFKIKGKFIFFSYCFRYFPNFFPHFRVDFFIKLLRKFSEDFYWNINGN